jgi:hypothetical protein
MLWKLEGVDDASLRQPMWPSGTSLLGLVQHLAAAVYGWFCSTFGREIEPLPCDHDEDADLRVDDDWTTADVVAFYRRAWVAADAMIDEHDLDETGTAWHGPTMTRPR